MLGDKLFTPIVGNAYLSLTYGACIILWSNATTYGLLALDYDTKPLVFTDRLKPSHRTDLTPIQRINAPKILIDLYHSLEITRTINEGDLIILWANNYGIAINNEKIVCFDVNTFQITDFRLNPISRMLANNRRIIKVIGNERKKILKRGFDYFVSSQYHYWSLRDYDEKYFENYLKTLEGLSFKCDIGTLETIFSHTFVKFYEKMKDDEKDTTNQHSTLWNKMKRVSKRDSIVWTK